MLVNYGTRTAILALTLSVGLPGATARAESLGQLVKGGIRYYTTSSWAKLWHNERAARNAQEEWMQLRGNFRNGLRYFASRNLNDVKLFDRNGNDIIYDNGDPVTLDHLIASNFLGHRYTPAIFERGRPGADQRARLLHTIIHQNRGSIWARVMKTGGVYFRDTDGALRPVRTASFGTPKVEVLHKWRLEPKHQPGVAQQQVGRPPQQPTQRILRRPPAQQRAMPPQPQPPRTNQPTQPRPTTIPR